MTIIILKLISFVILMLILIKLLVKIIYNGNVYVINFVVDDSQYAIKRDGEVSFIVNWSDIKLLKNTL